MQRFLISYDISSNKSRRTAAKILKNVGERIQRSVYIVEGTEKEIERINQQISELLEENDSLLVLPCCASCWEKAMFAQMEKDLLLVA